MSRSSPNLHLLQEDASEHLCDVSRVQNIWLKYKQDLVRTPIPSRSSRGPPRYGVNTSTFQCAPQHRKMHLAAAQEETLVETCRRFYRVTQSDGYLVSELDALLAMDMECSFVFPEDNTWVHDNEDDIIRDASRILNRLPPSSSELKFEPLTDRKGPTSLKWNERPEAILISTSVICMALWLAGEDSTKTTNKHGFLQFTNLLASLLHTTCRIAEQECEKQGWHIVIMFLWSTWQRSVMLYLWCIIKAHILEGFDPDDTTPRLTLTSLPNYIKSHYYNETNKSDYMCHWAYELLRNDAGSKALDFRRFHQRFNAKFGDKKPRCIEGSNEEDSSVCDGTSPLHCRRFVGGRRPSKQVHDTESCACKPMFWEAESYKRVQGARAVCIKTSNTGRLRYKEASAKTLSISHVWSHGQGGRPEEMEVDGKIAGFNTCLHERYSSIAESLDCDSYWIDTACIPSDDTLRREAISHINGIFGGSHATIVADKDIMSIDIEELSRDATLTKSALQLREIILATLLVCDWNVRAWTFLESLRGRQKLLLLCKNNQTIDLKETLEIVHAHGSIDISVLFVSTQHLWPSTARWERIGAQWASVPTWMRNGFMLVEDAAGLLSHRHASRSKDETVIWSLLLGDEVYKTPEALWKSRIGRGLNTGFILSSAPRLRGVPGFSWAPSRAAVSAKDEEQQQQLAGQLVAHPDVSVLSDAEQFYLAYDGYDTAYGTITNAGFQASWLLHIFPGAKWTPKNWSKKNSKTIQSHLGILNPNKSRADRENAQKMLNRLNLIASTYLREKPHGALLRPCGFIAEEQRVRAPPIYRGTAKGTLVAICGSEDLKMKSWMWRGVFDWENDVKLPEFVKENILLL